jgi:hypothetical protein
LVVKAAFHFGRLRTLILDLFCNPWLSGFACYSRTFGLSFCPF